jgi:hypothetical protein
MQRGGLISSLGLWEGPLGCSGDLEASLRATKVVRQQVMSLDAQLS